MSGYTCPFSRCRMPIRTYEELESHVDQLTKDPASDTHNLDLFTPEDLVAEVRHMTASDLRLEQSCGYYKEVADSWRTAYQAVVTAGGESGVQ